MNENLTKVCRVCFSEGSRHIFQKNFSQDFANVSSLNRILEKLRFVTMLKIDEGENLPAMICDLCIVQLNVAYNFKRQATDSDAKLRQYMIENGISIRKDMLMLPAPVRTSSVSTSSICELSAVTAREVPTPQPTTTFPQIRPISIKIETPEMSDTQSTISPMSSTTNTNDLPPIIISQSEAAAMLDTQPNNNNNSEKDAETSGSEIMLSVASTNSSGSEVMVTVPNVIDDHEFLRPIDPPPRTSDRIEEILPHPEQGGTSKTGHSSPRKRAKKTGMGALLESLKIDFKSSQTPEHSESKFRRRNDNITYNIVSLSNKTSEGETTKKNTPKAPIENSTAEPSKKLETPKKKAPETPKKSDTPKKKTPETPRTKLKNLKLNPLSVVIKKTKPPSPQKLKKNTQRKEKLPPQRKKADKDKKSQLNKLKLKLMKDKLMTKLKKHKDIRKEKVQKKQAKQVKQPKMKQQKRKN